MERRRAPFALAAQGLGRGLANSKAEGTEGQPTISFRYDHLETVWFSVQSKLEESWKRWRKYSWQGCASAPTTVSLHVRSTEQDVMVWESTWEPKATQGQKNENAECTFWARDSKQPRAWAWKILTGQGGCDGGKAGSLRRWKLQHQGSPLIQGAVKTEYLTGAGSWLMLSRLADSFYCVH